MLTHPNVTNAGVAALRGRLDNAGVPPRAYRLPTLDGWAIRLIGMLPARSEVNPDILKLEIPRNDYPAIRKAAATMLKGTKPPLGPPTTKARCRQHLATQGPRSRRIRNPGRVGPRRAQPLCRHN
jgi:hypothetical protein